MYHFVICPRCRFSRFALLVPVSSLWMLTWIRVRVIMIHFDREMCAFESPTRLRKLILLLRFYQLCENLFKEINTCYGKENWSSKRKAERIIEKNVITIGNFILFYYLYPTLHLAIIREFQYWVTFHRLNSNLRAIGVKDFRKVPSLSKEREGGLLTVVMIAKLQSEYTTGSCTFSPTRGWILSLVDEELFRL